MNEKLTSEFKSLAVAAGCLLTPLAVIALTIVLLVRSCRHQPSDQAPRIEQTKLETSQKLPQATLPPPPKGLERGQLGLASQTLYGAWVEEDSVVDDAEQWTGSTGVFGSVDGDGNKLYLVTNAHCLNLKALFTADGFSEPEIKAYALAIKFPTGVVVPVERCGIEENGVDLAFLIVDAQKLREGRDYVVLPFDDSASMDSGSEVVAVGSPLGLAGTQTFGHISAVRSDQARNLKYRIVQTDAAINHGNSGGPLFLRRPDLHGRGERYVCIGINTARAEQADNLGFALDAALLSSKFHWFDATPDGLRSHVGQRWFYDLFQ